MDELKLKYVEVCIPKFDIGKIVTSKRTGLPTTGQIVGIMVAKPYATDLSMFGVTFALWDELYPTWKSGWVYIVQFLHGPQKVISLQEYAEYTTEEQKEQHPYDDIPNRIMASYPEEDLELFDMDISCMELKNG